MDKYYLVKWDSNWADEMDIHGFVLFGEKEFKEFKEALNMFKSDERVDEYGEFSFYIGSNEEVTYENANELISEFKIEEITKEAFDIILNTLGGSYGFTDGIDFVFEYEDWLDLDYEIDESLTVFECKTTDNLGHGEFISNKKYETYLDAKASLIDDGYFMCGHNLFSNNSQRVTIVAIDSRNSREIEDYFKKKRGKTKNSNY